MLLTGTEPKHLGITLDVGSEVPASHRLMEVAGQQAERQAKGEERTAVYSPVISTLTLSREMESDTYALLTRTSAKLQLQ